MTPTAHPPPADDGGTTEPTVVLRVHLAGPAPRTAPPPDATPMRVVTDGAVYVFDPDTMTALRLPRDGTELRRDGEPLALLSWPDPVVGRGMELQLQVREDGVPTVRFTSAVRQVQRYPAPPPTEDTP
ncbi:hypothetical protein [Blastococcus sp. PRF04-17]|uniref:hypothetical protein n=1 Tax=Blastococcus sp. PRF04-17 TaxID=2933797 RepID=UPI001FF0E52A|nr:hypothetical protein [Blastococcus sp. PRF04-17]UOY01640.1 hypothetical protein MVA48_22425 [Blastococcus sp. PRF04-17]